MSYPNMRLAVWGQHATIVDGIVALLERDLPDSHIVEIMVLAEPDAAVGRILTASVDIAVVIVDHTSAGDGLTLVHALAEQGVGTLVICSGSCENLMVPALRAGALGFLSAQADKLAGLEAIKQVIAGHHYIDPHLSDALARRLAGGEQEDCYDKHSLSSRECEVLRLLALGFVHKEIAQQLGISPKTVESYHSRVALKLELPTRADIVRFALENGYLDVESPWREPVKVT